MTSAVHPLSPTAFRTARAAIDPAVTGLVGEGSLDGGRGLVAAPTGNCGQSVADGSNVPPAGPG
jgi:hypothetical protein